MTRATLAEPIRCKDGEKNLFDYEDTPGTEGMRQRLREWNAFLSRHWCDVFLTDREFMRVLERRSPEDMEEAKENPDEDRSKVTYLDMSRRSLYRVFNNNSFEQGGRFYGGWWQEVPRVYRPYITIDGVPTRELDYKGLHLAMIYAQTGEPMEDDPYSIDGIGADYRDLIKSALLKMINAREGQRIDPPSFALPPDMTWEQLQEVIAEKHTRISRYLRSGEGIRLQRLDSEIAEDVMLSLASQSIPVLPIHDSFIIDYRHESTLRNEMRRAYHDKVGAEIAIQADQSMVDHLTFSDHGSLMELLQARATPETYAGFLSRAAGFISLARAPDPGSTAIGSQ